jgi:3-hydroxyisobutyrate dehydrogenase-like beta-hydroxyacid dehydrogenase
MSKPKVGFIGLGLMGKPMALNIHKKGFPLSVYNRSPEKLKEFKKLGIATFVSPAELAKDSDVIITMITAPKDVKEVALGKNGIAESGNKNLVHIDMSTIGPSAAKEVAKGLRAKSIDFIDAPVTGSTDRAKTGELVIFVGGDKKIFEKVKPVLEAMGTELPYMGPVGSGQAIKLVNNLIGGETIAVLGEAFMLGQSLGLTKKQIHEALKNTFSISPNMKNKMPMIEKGEYPVMFSVANMRKDLKLGLTEKDSSTPLPILKTTEAIYKKTIDEGWGEEDIAATFKVISRKKN